MDEEERREEGGMRSVYPSRGGRTDGFSGEEEGGMRSVHPSCGGRTDGCVGEEEGDTAALQQHG